MGFFFFFLKHFSGSCFWNFIFSPNFVVDGKINLIFSNEKMHKVQMYKVQMPNFKYKTSNVNVGDTSLSVSDIPISENSSKKFFKRKNAQSSNAQTQMHKLQISMLVIHHHQLLKSQFLKILLKYFGELMAMNLILVHWNIIMDCVIRYKNMMLIGEMKFEELTLKLIHTDLRSQTTTVPPIK
jgi:hypothetical protein